MQVESIVNCPVDSDSSFPYYSEYDVWGCLQHPINVCKNVVEQDGFKTVHQGLHNYLQVLGKDEAESCEVLVIIEGTTATEPFETDRVVFFFTGVSWAPHVFDITVNSFSELSNASCPELTCPFEVELTRRTNKVSSRYQCYDSWVSGKWTQKLLGQFSTMVLWRCEYNAIQRLGDRSWDVSEVTSVEKIGLLWEPGMKYCHRLCAAELRAIAAAKKGPSNTLRTSDPTATATPSHRRAAGKGSRGRNGAGGRRGSGRGRGRAEGDVGTRQVDAPVPQLAIGDRADDDVFDVYDRDSNSEGELGDGVDEVDREAIHGEIARQYESTPGVEDVGDDVDVRVETHGIHGDLYESLMAEMDATGLYGDGSAMDAASSASGSGGALHAASSASGSGDALHVAPASDVLVPPVSVWEQHGLTPPDAEGLVLDNDRRWACRIIRGKPKGNLSVRCYRHRDCSFLERLKANVTDAHIVEWFCAVDANAPDDDQEERGRKRETHRILAKEVKHLAA